MPLASDSSVRAFKCPSCGAPLEPEVGTLTMKCPYCGGTVIIPESLRTPTPKSGPTMGEVFDFGLNGLDMNQIIGNAMHLPQAMQLAKQGQIDEAANIYSQITGMEHADAVEAVKSMAAGHAVSLTPGQSGLRWGSGVTISPSAQAASASFNAPGVAPMYSSTSYRTTVSVTPPAGMAQKSGGRSCGLLLAIVAVVAIGIVLLIGAMVFAFGGGKTGASLIPLGFAHTAMKFGSEGIGPGQFNDARHIGVDGSGNIIVADYDDGRIQTFDMNGKYVSGFSISSNGQKVYISSMAVSRSGQIYIVHDNVISIYDAEGNAAGQIGDDNHEYGDVAVGGDGKLYGIANDEDIVRFKSDNSIDIEVPKTFSNATGDSAMDTRLAVDGLGNMYILDTFQNLVLKFSPDGKFVNRFGGEVKDIINPEPQHFTSPEDIAVDGYGRVYVSDLFLIHVFDADGTFLKLIDMNEGPFGLAVDGNNNLYTVTAQKHVIEFAIQKPAGQ